MSYTLTLQGPLVVTHIPDCMTDEEQLEYFERIEREVLEVRKRHGALIIAGRATVWTPEQRKRHHAFHRRNQKTIRELCAASAMVMPEVSMIVRFALSTVMMLAPGSPTNIFHDESKARAFLHQQLSKVLRPAPAR